MKLKGLITPAELTRITLRELRIIFAQHLIHFISTRYITEEYIII